MLSLLYSHTLLVDPSTKLRTHTHTRIYAFYQQQQSDGWRWTGKSVNCRKKKKNEIVFACKKAATLALFICNEKNFVTVKWADNGTLQLSRQATTTHFSHSLFSAVVLGCKSLWHWQQQQQPNWSVIVTITGTLSSPFVFPLLITFPSGSSYGMLVLAANQFGQSIAKQVRHEFFVADWAINFTTHTHTLLNFWIVWRPLFLRQFPLQAVKQFYSSDALQITIYLLY